MAIDFIIRSWLFLVPLIPSVIIAIFVLYYLLFDRALRLALNNHIMAWASIERNILIFYPNWFETRIKCFFFHYFPLIMCILYPTIFYLTILIIVLCNHLFNYSIKLCGHYQCITDVSWIALWDSIGNYILPPFITVIFSIALLIRVLHRRYRIRGRIEWTSYKKLAAQLLPISALYIMLQLPPTFLYAAYSAGLSRDIAASYYSDGLFFTYWIVLFNPFASVVSLPNLRKKCTKVIFFWRTRSALDPQIFPMIYLKIVQTPEVILYAH